MPLQPWRNEFARCPSKGWMYSPLSVHRRNIQLLRDRPPQVVGVVHPLRQLFDRESLKLLGVHAIGERAAEIVHIGQAVLAFGGTLEYFRDAVFNYPTMAEAFKVAALDGLNKV